MDKNKEQILNLIIGMWDNNLRDENGGESFEGWCAPGVDDMIENEEQLNLMHKVKDYVDAISDILSDEDALEEYHNCICCGDAIKIDEWGNCPLKCKYCTEDLAYEVRGYRTKEDFDNIRFEMIEEGLINKEDAMRIGKECLAQYEIIKVQSMDLQTEDFIEILTK